MKKLIILMLLISVAKINYAQTDLENPPTIISASSTNPSYPTSNLWDTDPTTLWKSGTNSISYLYFTLSNTANYVTIILKNLTAPGGFWIDISPDNINWMTVASCNNNGQYQCSASYFQASNLFFCNGAQSIPIKYIRLKMDGYMGFASLGDISIFQDPTALIQSYTASSFNGYTSKYASLALDGDATTYWEPINNDQTPNFTINFNRYIKAAKVTITANDKGILADLISDASSSATINGYYYTLNNTETFYIIDPAQFDKIRFSHQGGIRINEISIAEFSINDFGIRYDYDNGGNMTSRTLVISASPSQKAARIAQHDTIIPMKPAEDLFAQGKVLIYPNPTKGLLKVEVENYPGDATIEMRMYDINGELLETKRYLPGETLFDLLRKPSGTYLLNISINKETHTWRIVKE